ncbi:protein-glutamate O-methyltransferase CheR [Horticoccus luteus]|uniref:protein-glutamate O-methyltransferase n=1 Tax=Horticoccus luteus TaxID=2862869 RepID=A0A8F9TYT8_9BACT|nr:protein-glutamate O-methyltransferase CheR [Horticoccus luteus]QYM80645.1 protein-glutamate O-methyltransferase CheR [Horticoccus luteus]
MTASSEPHRLSASDPVPLLLRDLVHERTGVYFEAERLGTMLEKLQPRVLARGCPSLLEYYYQLRYDSDNHEEWHRVLDAFSVPETYFWREIDQIRALVDRVVPAWFQTTTAPLRIWSAACATGEEPYTLAIALQEAGWGAHPIEIIASDASEVVLARARAAVYRERSFRALPLPLRERYFRAVPGGFELAPALASRVQFHWCNLVAPPAAFASAPVIFCRNVFIYFSPAAIARVAAAFAAHMPPGGHLFIGASESLLKIAPDFELTEIDRAFVYRRRAVSP